MNSERVLFESKKGRNKIIEKSNEYVLISPGGQAVFDKNPDVFNAVTSAINEYGDAKWSRNNKCGFRFQDNHSSFICSLSMVVHSALTGRANEEYKGRRIWHRDKNPYNLKMENLIAPSRQSIEIVKVDDCQFIKTSLTTNDGESHISITNFDKELYKIIKSTTWRYSSTAKTLQCSTVNGKQCCLYHLVWTYFNSNIDCSNWRPAVARFLEIAFSKSLSIDHKQCQVKSDRWDNRIENLQLLPKRLNSKKGSCTAKMQNNCFYIPTEYGEAYGKINQNAKTIEINSVSGMDTEERIENLRYFCKTGDFSPVTVFETLDANSRRAKKYITNIKFEEKLYQEVLNK